MYICVYARMYVLYMYMCIHIYVYIHIHKLAYPSSRDSLADGCILFEYLDLLEPLPAVRARVFDTAEHSLRSHLLQCVAVCCSVLQQLQCSTMRMRLTLRNMFSWLSITSEYVCCVNQGICCSVVQRVAACCSALQCAAVRCSALQCAAVRCSAVQCVAVRCSALQCAAVRCSDSH